MFEQGLKLVLAGPVGAGKTTTLRSLADTEPVSTEMPLSDGPMGEKTTTTVALDFATVLLDDGTPLQLFGLPGQEHFAHMRDIVMSGAFGVILLLAGDSPDIADHCGHWIDSIAAIDASLPIVIGITRTDKALAFRMDTVRKVLVARSRPMPVFTVDVRSREQAEHLVRALLLQMD